MPGLIGKKIGMTSVNDENGNNIPCTVLEVGPCVITQIKTKEKDGYTAVQLSYGSKKEKNTVLCINDCSHVMVLIQLVVRLVYNLILFTFNTFLFYIQVFRNDSP